MAALDIKSSEADELLVKATKAAVKKSGAKFFKTIQKRSTGFIELATRNSYSPENFKEIEDVLTFENLILLARFYAGEITKAKRKRKGVETLHDKVTKLMSDNRQRIILDVTIMTHPSIAASHIGSHHSLLAEPRLSQQRPQQFAHCRMS